MKTNWIDGGTPWQHAESMSVFAEPARQPRTPERRLSQAVLEQALLDLQRLDFSPRRDRRAPRPHDVVTWFRSVDSTWPFSFEAVCANLGLESDAVRRAVGLVPPGGVRLVARPAVVTLSEHRRRA
jgi:hypothetical protein